MFNRFFCQILYNVQIVVAKQNPQRFLFGVLQVLYDDSDPIKLFPVNAIFPSFANFPA
jgi:hypothetical protein